MVDESGCGKTTFAKMLLRLLDPTSGSVSLRGKDIAHMNSKELRQFRTEVQTVFQDPWASLSPRMRIYDIVAETLVVNQKLTRQELTRRVDESLTAVGLRPQDAKNTEVDIIATLGRYGCSADIMCVVPNLKARG
nr:ATP-binding cassette domain-containing protein [Halomonas sp. SH5A2]